MWHWESDIIAISKFGYIHEFEIKSSISDYKRDFKKRKHQFLGFDGPARFIYALSGDLWDKAKEIDIPEKAGLYLVHVNQIQIIKKPPLLRNVKVKDSQMRKLYRSLHYRAWSSTNILSKWRIEKEGAQK